MVLYISEVKELHHRADRVVKKFKVEVSNVYLRMHNCNDIKTWRCSEVIKHLIFRQQHIILKHHVEANAPRSSSFDCRINK